MPSVPEQGRGMRLTTDLFTQIEHAVYVALGALLSVTAVLALGGAGLLLWRGLSDWSGTDTIFLIIDRLLFVLLLIEILHTVRASIRSGALTCEPFLIVGLIASIRRVLVITLKTSELAPGGGRTPNESAVVFHSSMVELGVLGGLILIMVLSIFLLKRGGASSDADLTSTE